MSTGAAPWTDVAKARRHRATEAERKLHRLNGLRELHQLQRMEDRERRMVNSPRRRDGLPSGCKSDNNCITSKMAETRADLARIVG